MKDMKIKNEVSKNITIKNKYNYIKERVEIYKDFTFNLIYCVYDYYLDKETLHLDVDIENHYNFCFNKVCNKFIEEEINFKNNEELNKYFFTYFYHNFYKNNNENVKINNFFKFWNLIFEIDRPKNNNTFKVLVELYKIFNISLENK